MPVIPAIDSMGLQAILGHVGASWRRRRHFSTTDWAWVEVISSAVEIPANAGPDKGAKRRQIREELTYRVEASTNLVHWQSLGTATTQEESVDANASRFSHRFFRVFAEP